MNKNELVKDTKDFRVKIYGAHTLERYTKNIIIAGLENNGCVAFEGREKDSSAKNILFQLHGAPQAENDDKKILSEIRKFLKMKDDARKIIVMLHRPDELKKYGDFPKVLNETTQKIGLVFLGDKFIDDPFYPSNELILKRVIPHGFFPMKDYQKRFQESPIIIGSHTAWGEMRSVKHALKLLFNIFKLNQDGERTILGYLGGKPKEDLRLSRLKEITQKVGLGLAVKFLNVHNYSSLKDIAGHRENTVLVDDQNEEPVYFSLTYNIQLYYLKNTVRLGESSGSAHTAISIPVILEMNGAEKIEGLEVIKVPYLDANNIASVDFNEGARRVFTSIKSDRYKNMLSLNLRQSKIWDNTKIGKEYISLFKELGR